MTFRKLLEMMQQFTVDHPGHEAIDRQVVLRLGVPNGDDDEDIYCGGLQSAAVDAGCTEEFVLLLDADPPGSWRGPHRGEGRRRPPDGAPMSDPSGNSTRDVTTPWEDEGELARMRAEVYAERVLLEARLTGHLITRPIVAELIKSAFRDGAASRGRGAVPDAPDVPDGDRRHAVLVAENVGIAVMAPPLPARDSRRREGGDGIR